MKTIATLIATLVATAAFATEPAKTATPAAAPVATTAVTAPATPAAPAASAAAPVKAEHKCDPAKDKHCKVEKKAEVTPVKSEAPAAKDTAKTAEPAKK
jgi:hypothetical protein